MRFIDLTVEPKHSAQSGLDQQLAQSDEIVREELLNWRMSEELVLNTLSFIHGDPETYSDMHTAAETIQDHSIRRVDDERFYAYVQQAGALETSWWTAFFAYDFIHVPPVIYEDGIVGLTILGEFDALQDVISNLSDEVTITVESVGDYHGQGKRVTDRLTTRQFRALRAAADCGYYAVPRDGSLEDVAAELECTESTASDLLRRAERELVEAILTA